MNEKIDAAIEKIVEMVRTNMKSDDVLKVTQSILNLSHARHILNGKTPTRKQGAGA